MLYHAIFSINSEMDEWSGLVGLVSILIPCVLKFASRILISVAETVYIFWSILAGQSFWPNTPSLLPSQDPTFSCMFFSIMSCKRSRDFSHCSHLLHALMAALKETTSAWTPKCQHSFRSIKACCHFSHFSQAVMAEFSAIRLFLTQSLCGLWQENLNSFEFDGYRHDLMVDSMLIHVAPLAKSLETAVKSKRGTCAAHEKESTAHGAIAGPFQRHRSGCPASQRLASTDSAGFTGQLMRCPHCSIIQPFEGASSNTFEGGYRLNILKTGLLPAHAGNKLEMGWNGKFNSKLLNLQLGKFMQERQCCLPLLALQTCTCSRIVSDDAPLQTFRLIKKHQSFLPGRTTCSDHGIVAHDGGLPEWTYFFIPWCCLSLTVRECRAVSKTQNPSGVQKVLRKYKPAVSWVCQNYSRLSQIVSVCSLSATDHPLLKLVKKLDCQLPLLASAVPPIRSMTFNEYVGSCAVVTTVSSIRFILDSMCGESRDVVLLQMTSSAGEQ